MAQWTAAFIDSLPDSSFAYIETGGKRVDGRTEPRSLRHFPIRDADGKPDAAHVRNALARLPQSPFGPKARAKVEAAARELGIGQKAFSEVKAEPLSSRQLDRWLAGEVSRRILVVPFGGPLPGGKAGLDLDGDYFDEQTDLVGPFPQLRRTRDRLVDWHHDNDAGVPRGVPSMKGAILGHIELDAEPSTMSTDDGDYEGVAADFWANAGEKRLALVKALQTRGARLFGSSQAVPWAVQKAADGHIEVWPLYRHTLSTSPQNTYAVVPALKALLTADEALLDAVGYAAIKAALVAINDHIASDEGWQAEAVAAAPSAGSDVDGLTDAERAQLAAFLQEARGFVRTLRR